MTIEQGMAEIDEQAALWFSRRNSGRLNAVDEAEFAAWLARSEQHAQAYADMQLLWDDCDQLARPHVPAAEPAPVTPLAPRRRAPTAWLALAATVLLAVGGLMGYQWRQLPQLELSASAGQHELRQLQLADGSELTLNLGSTVQVRYYRDRREVSLIAGEAYFSVAPDAERPFRVDAGAGQVEVVGTRFTVRRSLATLAVAVEQGYVAVQPGRDGLALQQLQPGDSLEIDYQQGALRRSQVPTAEVGSWRYGLLVFRDRPLGELAQELSRYRGRPVQLDGAGLAARRLSGSLDIHQPERFVQALPQLLPVELIEQADGVMLLRERK
ncbi:FecR family protein [Pseudomonas abyssi]|jgi:transmembrane sensor|nr:FecR domain-containing protein [Pseudomonas abyssi]|tara:strand:+ start:76125 stop:77102 length:978 start_codon:yes stop_codon:yes gene_type:complete